MSKAKSGKSVNTEGYSYFDSEDERWNDDMDDTGGDERGNQTHDMSRYANREKGQHEAHGDDGHFQREEEEAKADRK